MQITVASTSALTTALASAQGGDTILLSAGSYGRLGLANLTIPGGVTIASADSAHPVVIAGIELNNVSGLTFRDIEVHLNTRTMNVVQIVLSDEVPFDHVEFQDVSGSTQAGLLIR